MGITIEKSDAFELEIMRVSKAVLEKKLYDSAFQFRPSRTGIGGNAEVARVAQSRADFRSEMSIVAKEARESQSWLRLTNDGRILADHEVYPLIPRHSGDQTETHFDRQEFR